METSVEAQPQAPERPEQMLDNKSILVTGGTGSFGQKFVRNLLDNHSPARIVVYSRDEMKQWNMQNDLKDHPKKGLVRFFIGDVRDKDRLHRAFSGIDFVIHAAALKIVPAAEYNPFEFIKTNIMGAMNVIDCAIDQKVRRVIALSTDKACNPINLYGATKLCSDKLFVAGNSYSRAPGTRFAVVRYGNVMGSRGSVIPLFWSLRHNEELPITDENMTRFMISLDMGVDLVLHALKDSVGGEIYVRKIPSMRVVDLAKTIAPRARLKIVGIRPGEKMHEQMISPEDAEHTYEYGNHYKILPNLHDWHLDPKRIGNGRKCPTGFCYSSDKNQEWMTTATLKEWLADEYGRENVDLPLGIPSHEKGWSSSLQESAPRNKADFEI